jgi:hypothetical protein
MNASYGTPPPSSANEERWSTRVRLDGALPPVWAHCGATADMLGELYARQAARQGGNANEARHGINYLVNELMENAIKFRDAQFDAVEVMALLEDGVFEIRVVNHAAPEVAERFQGILAELTGRDPGELLLERIEANAMGDDAGASGLGILTLMNDYGAQFGWHLVREDAARPVLVSTHASLRL